jgi:hypothetical protein
MNALILTPTNTPDFMYSLHEACTSSRTVMVMMVFEECLLYCHSENPLVLLQNPGRD